MTSTDTDGLAVGAYLERDDPRDALVGADGDRPGMRIGTASVRRRAQLLALEPTISVEPLRGNVETRLRKMRERGLDAIVLAACGLDRLGLGAEIGAAPRSGRDAAGGGAGCARAAGARGRGGARRARRPRGDAPPGRAGARVCRARSAPAASRRLRRITTGSTLRALIADEDGAWVERAQRRRSRSARGGAARGVGARAREGDRDAAAGAGAAARRARSRRSAPRSSSAR